MVITLTPELAAAVAESARKSGTSAESLALAALRQRFLAATPVEPRDEWERRLFSAASDCGVSPSHEDLSREALYD